MEKTKEKMKKVCFSKIVTVFEMENSEEHRSARNGLRDLQDRYRFQRRIENVELVLNDFLKIKMIKLLFDILPFSEVSK